MKEIVLMFSLFMALQSFGQGEMKIGIQAGANFSYRTLDNNDGENPLTDDAIRHFNTYETPEIGYRFAFVGDYQFSKHFNVEVGASVTKNQYVYFNSDLFDFFDPTSGSIDDLDGVESVERRSNYLYAGLPIRGIYRAGLSSLKFLGHIGISPQILIDNTFKNTVKYNDGSTFKQETEANDELSTFNFSPFFGVGLEWELDGKWSLRTEAVARYGALNINENSPVNTHLISSEFTAGIYYLLKSGKDSME